MPAVCAGSGYCSHCVHVCESWCLKCIQAFLASLTHYKGDMAEIQPLSLSLSFYLFSVLPAVTAITRRRAKACWDWTEEIWGAWDARLWLASKPWTVGCSDWLSAFSIGLLCTAACPPRLPLNFTGSQHPTSPGSCGGGVCVSSALFFFFCSEAAFVLLSLTWLSVHLCISERRQKMQKRWETIQGYMHNQSNTDHYRQTDQHRPLHTDKQGVTQIEQ